MGDGDGLDDRRGLGDVHGAAFVAYGARGQGAHRLGVASTQEVETTERPIPLQRCSRRASATRVPLLADVS